jgi:hypothetical protein
MLLLEQFAHLAQLLLVEHMEKRHLTKDCYIFCCVACHTRRCFLFVNAIE